MVLSNTNWGADRNNLLRLYHSFVRTKLDYGSIVYGSTCKSYIGMLDTVHNQGIRICLGAFRTSPMQSLYVEAHEPPLHIRRIKLALQFSVKLMSNVKNPAFPMVFQPDYRALFENNERAIKPFGLRLKNHLENVYTRDNGSVYYYG